MSRVGPFVVNFAHEPAGIDAASLAKGVVSPAVVLWLNSREEKNASKGRTSAPTDFLICNFLPEKGCGGFLVVALYIIPRAIEKADREDPQLTKLIRRAKDRYFPGGIRRTANRYLNRLFHRATRKSLASSFSQLTIEKGAVVCVHSALSGLGYLVNGPEIVILAMQDAIPECTLFMHSFSINRKTF